MKIGIVISSEFVKMIDLIDIQKIVQNFGQDMSVLGVDSFHLSFANIKEGVALVHNDNKRRATN